MNQNTNTQDLSTMTLHQVIKTFGADKPWKALNLNPMRWASQFIAEQLNKEGKVLEQPETGFANSMPTVVDTNTPDKLLEAKQAIEEIFEDTGKALTETFQQARNKIYNPNIMEVVTRKEDKQIAQVVEIHNLIQQGRKNLNWVAKLQLTELPVTIEGEDGYEEALAMKATFEHLHTKQYHQALQVIVDTFEAMGKEYARAQQKAKQKAYQEKLAQEKKEREEAKAAAKERARKSNTPQGKMEMEFSKAKQAAIQAMYRGLNYRQDHVKRAALAEYKRLVDICMVSKVQAAKQILNRYC